MLRMVGTNPLDDQIFSGDVGFSDEIDVAFVCDLRDSETLDQQVACVARDLSGEVKHVSCPFGFCWWQSHLLRGNLQDLLDLPVPVSP